jgi:hypothetical protein
MFETIYRTSDGKEYKTREEAIKHETRTLRKAYEEALANYHYVRFSEHRCNVKNYLLYKHMTVDEFLKLKGNEALTRTSARKKLWEWREYYKGKVKEGERRLRRRKAVLREQMENIRQEEAQMKEE